MHLFVGPDFVVTRPAQRGAGPRPPYVDGWRADRELLELGAEAVLYAILDRVVDGYAPVVAGLENDIDEIESEIFAATRRCRGGSTS